MSSDDGSPAVTDGRSSITRDIVEYIEKASPPELFALVGGADPDSPITHLFSSSKARSTFSMMHKRLVAGSSSSPLQHLIPICNHYVRRLVAMVSGEARRTRRERGEQEVGQEQGQEREDSSSSPPVQSPTEVTRSTELEQTSIN